MVERHTHTHTYSIMPGGSSAPHMVHISSNKSAELQSTFEQASWAWLVHLIFIVRCWEPNTMCWETPLKELCRQLYLPHIYSQVLSKKLLLVFMICNGPQRLCGCFSSMIWWVDGNLRISIDVVVFLHANTYVNEFLFASWEYSSAFTWTFSTSKYNHGHHCWKQTQKERKWRRRGWWWYFPSLKRMSMCQDCVAICTLFMTHKACCETAKPNQRQVRRELIKVFKCRKDTVETNQPPFLSSPFFDSHIWGHGHSKWKGSNISTNQNSFFAQICWAKEFTCARYDPVKEADFIEKENLADFPNVVIKEGLKISVLGWISSASSCPRLALKTNLVFSVQNRAGNKLCGKKNSYWNLFQMRLFCGPRILLS